MDKRLTSTLTVAAIVACVAVLAAQPAAHPEITVAQNEPAAETTAPPPAPPKGDASAVPPQRYPETAAEVAECMKTWDAQTGMSKAEYEAACKRTLKYYPEDANTPPR
ncbi:hypothetical protein [Hyphomicrobium sp.]|uniref:hypothetical protein n=1 Tax=Hyphomicrobium sp. TaxID=82 RepID=UPI003F6F3C19